MSVYNGAKYLREAVDAIRAQTFSQFELIIVDDGSTDGTIEILCAYSDPRIRLIRNDRNLGPAVARNRAFAEARGEYIAIQDADDASVPNRLAVQVAYFDAHPDVALLGATVLYVQTNDNFAAVFPGYPHFDFDRVVGADALMAAHQPMYDTAWLSISTEAPRKALVVSPLSNLSAKWALLSHCSFCNTSVMFRRKLYDQLGGFPEQAQYRYCEDYELFSRYARHARVANLAPMLVTWRTHETSTSYRNEDRQRQQVNDVAKSNLCWVMGWEEMDSLLWSAWRKFWYTPGISPVPFSAREVEVLSEFLPRLTSAFYVAYDLHGEEVGRHRREMHYMWARHAFGLAYRGGPGRNLRARFGLTMLGAKLLWKTMRPAVANRATEAKPSSTDQ
jgi:glycosyltransferase involved in cell wall biosynthesis